MLGLQRITRKLVLLCAVFVVAAAPLQVLAEESPGSPVNGITAPTGAAAGTYSYNQETGLWENAYYTWNPVTKETLPKFQQTYTYNPSTGQYDTTTYLYNAAAGQYEGLVLSVTIPPAGAMVIGGPPAAQETAAESPTAAAENSEAVPSSLGSFNTAGSVTVNNQLTAKANSGDALVLANTTAGSAASGNALSMATVLSILQSNTSLQGGNIATFTKDIGDWQGDLVIDPSALSNLTTINTNGSPSNLTINSRSTGRINNDIDLAAGSGNASVVYNTTAGDAATGNADTIANIVNVINSIISAGQSFIGTININGNLDGDILMPPDSLNSLLASNSTSLEPGGDNSLDINLSDSASITNNLELNAQTGTAMVSGNTTAGDAKSGSASTNITLLNLTGKQVVGSDALLVFVNVMGQWVGMIVNAPAGSSAAALGGGITANSSLTGDNNINSATESSINNNVRLNSTSGNALVSKNTTAGNAASGNASASINLLNISTSSLSLSNWLGILFINVFGSWNGSFGIDTAAGNRPAGGSGGNPAIAGAVNEVKVFSFVPAGGAANSFRATPVVAAASDGTISGNSTVQPTVLAAVGNNQNPTPKDSGGLSLAWTAGSSLFILAGLLSAEEAIAKRKAARAKFRQYLNAITVQPLKRY